VPLHSLHAEWDAELRGSDPLGFPGYTPPDEESVLTGVCALPNGDRYALIEGRFDVMAGSMGAVHGERVVRAYRRAIEERLVVVVVAASGGARMQEGMVSLIQLARTAAAARAHADAGLLSLAVLRSPTTGGVYASYASLADVRAAEVGAVIGFAGPRVVELTTGERLPETSHSAESAFAAGLVDALLVDDEMAEWVEGALGVRQCPLPARHLPDPDDLELSMPGPWGEVLRARAKGRATGIDVAAAVTTSWTELHGTDPSIRTGLATAAGRRVVMVAMDRYAGRPTPAGYRQAQRAIQLADRLGTPLVTLVDTPGADPGPASEAQGVAGEIARTFAAMAACRASTVAVCVGEGGSGGALALAAADRLLIQEHAVFSVIAPEGAAAILERDAGRAPDLAERLKLTAAELLELGIVDEVVPDDGVDLATALHAARPGDRHARFDAATARWLR
jgi:acyl-CoA carboxylase subunit beta